MDICICKTNKHASGLIKVYVALSSALYLALSVYAFISQGNDFMFVTTLITLLIVILLVIALWRMRAGHSYLCALLWAYVSPIAELHKSIRSLSL